MTDRLRFSDHRPIRLIRCIAAVLALFGMGAALTILDASLQPLQAQTNVSPNFPSVNRPRPVRPQRPKIVVPKPLSPFNPGRLVRQPKKKAEDKKTAPAKSPTVQSNPKRKSASKTTSKVRVKQPVNRTIAPPPHSPVARPLGTAFLSGTDVSVLVGRPHADQILIVLIDDGAPAATATEMATTYNIEVDREDDIAILDGRLVRFRLSPDQPLADILGSMSGDYRVATVQPDFIYTLQQVADVSESEKASESQVGRLPQYAPARMGLDRLTGGLTGQNVTISIIDTGIDRSHRELAHAVLMTHDATGLEEEGASGNDKHGTAIASVIAANYALAGIAPGADLLDVRVFHKPSPDAPVRGTSHWIIAGLDWSSGQGADIYNLSFAGPEDPLLERAIEHLATEGAILIGAAGNNGPEAAPAYPAAYPAVVAVTATDEMDLRYAEANRGSHIALSAPGVDVISAAPDNSYNLVSGTSVAAAHVSGIVALLLESRADLDPSGVHMALTSSATDLGRPGSDPDFGAGLVAAPDAIETALAVIKAD